MMELCYRLKPRYSSTLEAFVTWRVRSFPRSLSSYRLLMFLPCFVFICFRSLYWCNHCRATLSVTKCYDSVWS